MEKSQGNTLYDCLGKEWRVGEKIGTGGFGTVYKASDEASDKASEYPNKNLKFAVKIVSYTEIKSIFFFVHLIFCFKIMQIKADIETLYL